MWIGSWRYRESIYLAMQSPHVAARGLAHFGWHTLRTLGTQQFTRARLANLPRNLFYEFSICSVCGSLYRAVHNRKDRNFIQVANCDSAAILAAQRDIRKSYVIIKQAEGNYLKWFSISFCILKLTYMSQIFSFRYYVN